MREGGREGRGKKWECMGLRKGERNERVRGGWSYWRERKKVRNKRY